MKYHYFYKITNKLNGHFYYGVHNTDNLEDGYMGSGKRLRGAYEKYGIENFEKENLKFFDTIEEAFEYEHTIVNEEMIKNPNCYNIQIGGKYFNTCGMVTVKDKNGKAFGIAKSEMMFRDDVEFVWKGKHHTEESKEKTRKTMTPKNSTNPRVGVNKDGIVKYLLKIYLDEYIAKGWKLGRKGYTPRKHAQGKEIK